MVRVKQRRGFAEMDKEKQRQIASRGGKKAHAMGRAHEWTSSEAREAGRKGGKAKRTKHGNDAYQSLAGDDTQTEGNARKVE